MKDSNKEKEMKETRSGAGTPTQDSNHGDMDLRLTNSTQSIQSVVSQQINNTDSRSSKRRCRDFDEKVKKLKFILTLKLLLKHKIKLTN